MKVSLSGVSRFSDTLQIDIPKRVNWQDVTALLNIDGVSYYYVSGLCIGVRYSRAIEVPNLAANCLRVVIQHFGINVEMLSIGIHDCMVNRDTVPELANDIWSRTVSASTPEPLPLERVESRGTGPAYWLR